jgi:DNA-directed RNA polymerase specialized sigma24 family protein
MDKEEPMKIESWLYDLAHNKWITQRDADQNSDIAWWLYELAHKEWITQRDADPNSDVCKAAHDLMVAAEVAYSMTLRLHHTKKRACK